MSKLLDVIFDTEANHRESSRHIYRIANALDLLGMIDAADAICEHLKITQDALKTISVEHGKDLKEHLSHQQHMSGLMVAAALKSASDGLTEPPNED